MEAVLQTGELSHLIKGAQSANEKQVRFESWQPSPGGSVIKNLSASARDWGSIPGLGRSPGEGNGNPLQYSCLENFMDRGAWWAIFYGVTKSWTRLSD